MCAPLLLGYKFSVLQLVFAELHGCADMVVELGGWLCAIVNLAAERWQNNEEP